MARSADATLADYTDGLQLLTTHFQPLVRPFVVTGDTSAATAQAGRLAALIYANYPDLWPETIRALSIHSAEWTPTMWHQFAPAATRKEINTLLRCCGFGVPNLDAALWSAGNALTLLVQDKLQPFEGDSMKEMNIHSLPWPTDTLESLGSTPVELRVTLSYFIEPNPGRRGWVRKFRYMSHGLRFDVKTPEETVTDFVSGSIGRRGLKKRHIQRHQVMQAVGFSVRAYATEVRFILTGGKGRQPSWLRAVSLAFIR